MSQQHPVLQAIDVMESALKDVAQVDPIFMSTDEKREALVRLRPVTAMLEELGLRVLVTGDDVAEETGDRDVAAWLDHHNRIDRPAARKRQRVGEALDQRWRLVQDGMRDGVVDFGQADAITAALDRLPPDLDPEIIARA